MSLWRSQKSRTRGSRARLPVERGVERSATDVIRSPAAGMDGEAVAIVEDDVHAEHALADADRDLVEARPQVEQRDVRVAGEAAAVIPIARRIVAVDVVAHGDRVAPRVRDGDADPHRAG